MVTVGGWPRCLAGPPSSRGWPSRLTWGGQFDLYGSGAAATEQAQHLEFTIQAGGSGTEFGARVTSVFLLRGDFDIQVDFAMLQWPDHNGVRTAIALTDALFDDDGVERSSLSSGDPLGAQEAYIADFVAGPIVLVATQDLTGRLRLVRSGATQTGYYWSGSNWIPILTGSAPIADQSVQLHIWSHDYAFQHQLVRAAFDNFTVVSGDIVWGTPATATTWSRVKALFGDAPEIGR